MWNRRGSDEVCASVAAREAFADDLRREGYVRRAGQALKGVWVDAVEFLLRGCRAVGLAVLQLEGFVEEAFLRCGIRIGMGDAVGVEACEVGSCRW